VLADVLLKSADNKDFYGSCL